MADRSLRILIADPRRSVLVQIEKTLNHLGYYCVAPVLSFDEIMTLTHPAFTPFDVLIASAELGSMAGVDMVKFCREANQVRHSFVYENQTAHIAHIEQGVCQSLSVQVPPMFDHRVAKDFMARVDAPPVQQCLNSSRRSLAADV
jgi:DNA-binding NtrC family response regulator